MKGYKTMSEVDNKDPLERIIHQAFHDIANKHGIDADLVAEIITEYDEIMSKAIDGKIIIEEN